jgi:hypothetical protein
MAGSAFAGNSGPLAPGFAGCSTTASFLAGATVLNPSWVTFDGAVVSSAVLGPYAMAPCFDPSTVSVKLANLTLGNVVAYAGFTEDSIAGLYQVNVVLPLSSNLAGLVPSAATATTATPYTIQVGIGGVFSQPGVNIYLSK